MPLTKNKKAYLDGENSTQRRRHPQSRQWWWHDRNRQRGSKKTKEEGEKGDGVVALRRGRNINAREGF